MVFALSASWNSRSITHLANYPSRSLPMNSSDESNISVRGTRRKAARRIQEAFGPFASGQSMQVGIASHYIFRDNKVAFLETSRASKHGASGGNRFIPKQNA